jgi:hypothetical protein
LFFHIRVLCFPFDFLERKQDQGHRTKPIETHNKLRKQEQRTTHQQQVQRTISTPKKETQYQDTKQ